MVHIPKIKDEETNYVHKRKNKEEEKNYGPQTKE
jgi:hypothetical protein